VGAKNMDLNLSPQQRSSTFLMPLVIWADSSADKVPGQRGELVNTEDWVLNYFSWPLELFLHVQASPYRYNTIPVRYGTRQRSDSSSHTE